jgi:membrane-associated phospholipid phosphatase
MSSPVETDSEQTLGTAGSLDDAPGVSAHARSTIAPAVRAPVRGPADDGPVREGSTHEDPARAPVAVARSRWWVEVVAIAWLAWVYDQITNLAPLREGAALSHARGILHLERTLHLDPELTLNRWLSGHHTLGLLVSDYYDNAHFIVTLGLLAWLWWRRPDLYRPLRSSLVLINVLGFIVFWKYPVAPPRMLVHAGFNDVVASTHAFGSWHTGSLASDANQFAAMPSLHMAWAAWCGLALWWLSPRRELRALAIVYPCLTALAVLGTGNHFLADVLAGLLTAAVAVLLVLGWRRYRMSQTCYEVQDQVDSRVVAPDHQVSR